MIEQNGNNPPDKSPDDLEYTLVVVHVIYNLHVEIELCAGEHILPPSGMLIRSLPSIIAINPPVEVPTIQSK